MTTLAALGDPSLITSQAWLGETPEVGAEALPLVAVITLGLLLVSFVHAGSALLFRHRAAATDARSERLTRTWDPAVMDFLFEGHDVEAVHTLVGPDDGLMFVDTLLGYARRVAGDELDRIREIAAPYLPLVAGRLRSRSPGGRAQAVQTLGDLGWRAYVDEITAALDDPSPLVSIVAARALCHQDTVEYLPAVLSRLERFHSWTPTFLASMMASAGPVAAHALRETLWDEEREDRSRAIAAEALQQLNDFRSAGAAARVLEVGGSRALIVAAIRLLGQVGRESHLGAVLARIEDPDFVVRVAAVDAVASLGGQEELEKLQDLVTTDPSRWVALHAARGLMGAGRLTPLRSLAASTHERSAIGAQVLSEAGRR